MALILVPHPKWSNTGFWFSHREIQLVWCLPTVGNRVEPSSFRFPSKLPNRKEREHLVPQLVKNSPAVQETPVGFLGWEVPWRRDRLPTPVFLGFPGSSDGKESSRNAGDLGLILVLGRSWNCVLLKKSRFYCVLLLKKKGRMDVRIGILSEAFYYMCIQFVL